MGKPSKAVSLDRYRQRIYRAMVFIEQNLDGRPTLEEIAAAAPFSKYHFSRVFSVITGESVTEFMRRLYLERAARQLRFSPNRTITDIALDSGFSSSQNFAKAFRNAFGESPSQFREKAQACLDIRNIGNASSHMDALQERLSRYETEDSFMNSEILNVDIKTLPDMHVAFLRRFGPYGPEIGPLFEQVIGWAVSNGLMANMQVIGLYHDNPDSVPTDKMRSDACVTIPEGTSVEAPITTQTIQGGEFASFRTQIRTDQFHEAWDKLVGVWMPQSGYEPAQGPGLEIYHGQAPEKPDGLWDVEICVPVLPMKA